MSEEFRDLVSMWEQVSTRFSDRPLFGTKRSQGWVYETYGEIDRHVQSLRTALASLGVGAGDRVGVISDNRQEWGVLVWATLSLGAVFVPMYEAQVKDDWAFIIRDSGAKIVFGAKPKIVAALDELKPSIPTLERVLGFDLPANDERSYAALLAGAAGKPSPARPSIEPDQPAGFIYTSGTMGEPKGVVLTHKNFCSNINAIQTLFPISTQDRSLAILPWAHALGQTADFFMLQSVGMSITINDDVTRVIANLAEVKPTVLVVVPRIFNRIYDGVNQQMREKPKAIAALFRAGIRAATKKNRGTKLSASESLALKAADALIFKKVRARFGGRLKFTVCGSAALSKEVAEFVDALGIEVYEGYGLTETAPVVAVNYPGNRKLGSVGRPLGNVRVEIDRAATGDEKNGEIVVYGPNVMRGYHNRPDENARAFTSDGGLRSGDMGHLDADGYLYITGRIKEQYKLETGKYVVPSPLEEQLKLSPYIANVMLYGANKPFNVALVVLDPAHMKRWAEEHHVAFDLRALAENAQVRELVKGELERYSADFRSYERPKAFALTSEDFTVENGQLTMSLKVKRQKVIEKYDSVIQALYGA